MPFQSGVYDGLVKLQRRISPGSAAAYAVAASCIAVATLLRWAIGLAIGDALPTYYVAVFFAALVGGAGPGVFAAIAALVVGWLLFIAPESGFVPDAAQVSNLLLFFVTSLIVVWTANRLRSLKARLESEENSRRLVVEELAHRLKNKIATIQSIISFQLREHPEIRHDLLSRLGALSATDDLIMAAQGRGAHLRDILSTELSPYDVSRISMTGPNLFLSSKLALTMALLFHELATNAAKYGALSSSAGHLSVAWSRSESELTLEWCESAGPIVAPPRHRGFGMRLLSRALDQLGGKVEMRFEPSGLVCKMSVKLAESTPSIVPETMHERAEAVASH